MKVCVVENLNLRAWFGAVLPWSIAQRSSAGTGGIEIYAIDASGIALALSRAMSLLSGAQVRVLDYRLVDVRDEEGILARLKVAYHDLAKVQADAVRSSVFQACLPADPRFPRLAPFLTKGIVAMNADRGTMWRALLLVQIALWKSRRMSVSDPTLMLEDRPWIEPIRSYAKREGVQLKSVRPGRPIRRIIDGLLSARRVASLVFLRERFYHLRSTPGLRSFSDTQAIGETASPKIAVQYSGYLNLEQPGHYSDLFFWQESSLGGEDLILCSGLPQDPIDGAKARELENHGIRSVAFYSRAAGTAATELFLHWPRSVSSKSNRPAFGVDGREARWIERQAESYHVLSDYWAEFFRRYEVRLLVSWYRFDEKHIAIADAMESAGGVTAIYQRGFQPDPTPEIEVDADLMFGYAPADAQVEAQSGSTISYHIAVGYFGDHRIALLREAALQVRSKLMAGGAQYVMAYFDENSGADARWHTGHEFTRHNYAFLLQKVLDEPWLGLALKPKVPSTLRSRLGPLAELLESAIATGRCYVYGGDEKLHGARPPLEAALAADVAVHGHLCAATAGFEAALAGVPTLLLDREGWPRSPMYKLGVGRVVFTAWPEMWAAILAHRQSPKSVPEFGDWSTMIDGMDPFRDGRAAERMGTYLQWVLDGFREGHGRDMVLSAAAERYARRWGADKVNRVSGGQSRAYDAGASVAKLRVGPSISVN